MIRHLWRQLHGWPMPLAPVPRAMPTSAALLQAGGNYARVRARAMAREKPIMGRHSKAFAEVLATFRAASLRMRQFEEWAKVQPDDVQRILFRQWAARAKQVEGAGRYVPSCPSYLRGLTCGARKKNGERCGSTTLCANGRCKFHGGASTGPRSPEGRAKALENLKLGRLKRGKS